MEKLPKVVKSCTNTLPVASAASRPSRLVGWASRPSGATAWSISVSTVSVWTTPDVAPPVFDTRMWFASPVRARRSWAARRVRIAADPSVVVPGYADTPATRNWAR